MIREAVLPVLVIAALALVIARPRQIVEGMGVEETAAACQRCKKSLPLTISRMLEKYPLKPGEHNSKVASEDCRACRMTFVSPKSNNKAVNVVVTRNKDGSYVLTGLNFDGNNQYNHIKCTSAMQCADALSEALGTRYVTTSTSTKMQQGTPMVKALGANGPKQYEEVELPQRVSNTPNTLKLRKVYDDVVDVIKASGFSRDVKGKLIADITFVRPLKNTAIAKGFVWDDVDRVYMVIGQRTTGNMEAWNRWAAARRALGQGTRTEDFSKYMIHLELYQLMQMQAFIVNAGRLMVRAVPATFPKPTENAPKNAMVARDNKIKHVQLGITKASGKPGGPASVHQLPAGVGRAGFGSSEGIVVVLACGPKNVDEVNSTTFTSSCGGPTPLVFTLLHEYSHLLAGMIDDPTIRHHNYAYWAFLRFLELTLVAGGLLKHDWRQNAGNTTAKNYSGYDPFYQADWTGIRSAVMAYGGSAEDRKSPERHRIGSNRGWERTVWDDMWQNANSEMTDETTLAKFKALFQH